MTHRPLEKSLRTHLKNVVDTARDTAEAAAREALNQLGIGDPVAPPHLDDEQRALRKRLRAHGRQLGDARTDDGQAITALAEETAYEQWHRMLFARFLAENGLLLYDGVPITLADCADLAQELNYDSPWCLAAECAAKMLPQIFRLDSPCLSLKFASDKTRRLEALLASLEDDVFQASDAIGWLYQFWQTKRKEAINHSEVKIGARELPAVTQLFTEPYMVSFLLDNSLGAWYAAPKLAGKIFATEAEARAAAASPDIPLAFLRLVQNEDMTWTPAAGSFESWPKSLADFTLLDPCCGSGHFLVAAMLMLVPMRMELEGLDAHAAVDAVLRQNLHGLELDPRCVQLAAFAVATEAWRYPAASGYRQLPHFNLACDGVAPQMRREEWLRLARMAAQGDDDTAKKLSDVMGTLYDTFQNAPVLGSLVNPANLYGELYTQSYAQAVQILRDNLDQDNDDAQEAAAAAHGIVDAMELLQKKYTLVITNPPYLARGKQGALLKDFSEKHYGDAKNELATVFLCRCLEFCRKDGTVSLVLPQNWLFLTTYRKFRENLVTHSKIHWVAKLGPGAFETISGEIVKATLFSAGAQKPSAADAFYGLDVSSCESTEQKSQEIRTGKLQSSQQQDQLNNPDARIVLSFGNNDLLLQQYANSYQGVSPADYPRFGRFFWEKTEFASWCFWQTTNKSQTFFDGTNLILDIKGVRHKAEVEGGAYIRGEDSWGKPGIVINAIGTFLSSIYTGKASDTNVAVVVPHDPAHLPAIYCYCSSPEYSTAVRKLDQKLNVTNATLVKVPFDLSYWSGVAAERYPHGLPAPFTDDPTQWLFHGHPCGSVVWDESAKRLAVGADRVDGTVLHVAVARLLGYRWPAETDSAMELAAEMRQVMARNESLLPLADGDGIVCIPAVRGEQDAASRLQAMLAAAYGDAWSAQLLDDLLTACGCGDHTLEYWLRNRFFLQHARLFGSRPFIWHIWDGLPDGFAALVNYHRLDRKALESLVYTYLGDWMTRQKADLARGVDGARQKLDAAEALKARLLLILAGDAPYDIFVRWKPLAEQPVGWNPDLNDGVRLNIRPFVLADVLREKQAKLNIKWDKDRGRDVESAPWYPLFHGDRINDHHLTLAEKHR